MLSGYGLAGPPGAAHLGVPPRTKSAGMPAPLAPPTRRSSVAQSNSARRRWISAHRVPPSQNRAAPTRKAGIAPVALLIVTPNNVLGTGEGGSFQAGPMIAWSSASAAGSAGRVPVELAASDTEIVVMTAANASSRLVRLKRFVRWGTGAAGATVSSAPAGRRASSPASSSAATARSHKRCSRAVSPRFAPHASAMRSTTANSCGTLAPVQ